MFWFFLIKRYSKAECSSWLIASACLWSRRMWGLSARKSSKVSTGFLCKPGDPAELAKTIETYFLSDLFTNLRSAARN